MNRWVSLLLLGAGVYATECQASSGLPSVKVPSCEKGTGSVQYDRSVPNGKEKFPLTKVDLCYTDSDIKITFTAFEEVNFFYNTSHTTNDPLYEYEVMEAFIYHGTSDPKTYLEFEVSPNNVTWQAFIYNPSKVRAAGAPFDGGKIEMPIIDGLVASTSLDRDAGIWVSNATIPLGLFNVEDGEAEGTKWRMNFFRTVVSPDTFPAQGLGAWNPTNMSNFHMTPFFGHVLFV
ncbi:putative carbohydrate-binding family 9-subgroup [Rosellinia necatrix]|uniref:Putative carbohydrate-binding family 9-subgroup n=1 Tax=Rosellinia necatrix TaxID=77044 RepID=A0A1W2TID9_ROSNE|nr:putative carbohydrate-binding family 9-subgroup [Rosellinia necatrix]